MKLKKTLYLWALGILLVPAFAWSEPCAGLSEASADRYFELANKAVQAYLDENYGSAVTYNLQALEVCNEDPRTTYNLARAYHQLGNCGMGLSTYEALDEFELDRKMRKKVANYRSELEGQCIDYPKFTIQCQDKEAEIELGPLSGLRCGDSGRIAPGEHRLEVYRPEHKSYGENITLEAKQTLTLTIPALVPLSAFGFLQVSCSEGVEFFDSTGPDGQQRRPCPFDDELPVGSYQLVPSGGDEVTTVEVLGQQQTSAQLVVVFSPHQRAGLFFAVSLAPGFGFATGTLYDGDEKTDMEVTSISHLSFAGRIDAGYAWSERWAALGRLRVDQSLGLVGALVLRWVAAANNDLAIRVDGGLGGGVLAQPVFLTDGSAPDAHAGPIIALVGGHLAYAFTKQLSFVGGVDLNLGFSDFGAQLDLHFGVEFKL